MIKIAGYNFDGPYQIGSVKIDRAALYVILDEFNRVVDIGQSSEVGTRLENHDRKSCWDRNGGIRVSILWTPSDLYSKETRGRVEGYIRSAMNPSCGDK